MMNNQKMENNLVKYEGMNFQSDFRTGKAAFHLENLYERNVLVDKEIIKKLQILIFQLFGS